MQIWGACMLHALPWVPVSEPIWFLELVVVERLPSAVWRSVSFLLEVFCSLGAEPVGRLVVVPAVPLTGP